MATPVKIPKLNFSMSEGTITSWLVADGARVEAGTPLYELEAEKSVQEIESPASGSLKIRVQAGETCPVGTVIGEIT
jgi:pyruvate/2-oxoglutarate dehydrogenase complex dihydrolipoamide acyltransferase (E2) component